MAPISFRDLRRRSGPFRTSTQSLCNLCVLCDSVVSDFSRQFTTESQRTQRLHREKPSCSINDLSAVAQIAYTKTFRRRQAPADLLLGKSTRWFQIIRQLVTGQNG